MPPAELNCLPGCCHGVVLSGQGVVDNCRNCQLPLHHMPLHGTSVDTTDALTTPSLTAQLCCAHVRTAHLKHTNRIGHCMGWFVQTQFFWFRAALLPPGCWPKSTHILWASFSHHPSFFSSSLSLLPTSNHHHHACCVRGCVNACHPPALPVAGFSQYLQETGLSETQS